MDIERAYRAIVGRQPAPEEAVRARYLAESLGELALYQSLSASREPRSPLTRSITLPVNDRPWYLQESLVALRAAFERFRARQPDAVARYELVVFAEPHLESVRECLAIDFIPMRLAVNRSRQGARRNPFQVLDSAFGAGSAFNLHLEDDVVLSPHAFDLVHWYDETFRRDPLAYLSYSLFADSLADAPAEVLRELPRFEGLGWCAFRESWTAHIRDNWFRDDDPEGRAGWDWQMHHVCRTRGLRTLQPALSRSTHIGRDGGTHCTPDLHDGRFARVKLCDREVPGFRIVR